MFPPTQWQLVKDAAQAHGPRRREALDALLSVYRPVLVRYLISWSRCSRDVAEDIVQEFTCDKILCGSLLTSADQHQGRFRQLLVVAISRFYISENRSARRHRHRSLDDMGSALPAFHEDDSPAQLMDRAWAREVIQLAAARMKVFCEKTGRIHLWKLFEGEVLRPFLDGDARRPMSDLAITMGLSSPAAANNRLVTAKRIYRRQLVAVLALMGETADEETMLHDLFTSAGKSVPATMPPRMPVPLRR